MLISSHRFKSKRLDFETHLKYAKLIAELSENLKIATFPNPKLSALDIGKLKDKIQLVKLTKISIDQEYKIVSFDKDYSTASVLWLPIKTYYLIYHLLCIMDCLLSGKMSSLTSGHHDCIKNFNDMLENSVIQFNKPLLNTVSDVNIFKFVTKSGEHLKESAPNDVIYQLLMKKIANDKIENYQIVNALSGKRPKDRVRINNFKSNIKVSIFDFFHSMRLRMNYRNLNFVDNIPSADTKLYFEEYYTSADNFYKAFTKHITDLIEKCT